MRFLPFLIRLLARLLFRFTLHGTENVPLTGPALLTMNHLGGADPLLALAFSPRHLAVAGKIEILHWPVLGAIARAYGMIPLRRGEPDRATLKHLLAVLQAGRALLIAPEGRESLTGALEETKGGPAFLALQSQSPILPVALTGTAWKQILPAWRKLRRPCVTLTYGQPYRLPAGLRRREAAETIMRHIAALLPPAYHGVYADPPHGSA